MRQSKAKRADELERFIFDAYGFLVYALQNEVDTKTILTTLCHDIGGLAKRDAYFSPRVSGYGRKMENQKGE